MTNPCGNCVGGVMNGAICTLCNGTTFISTNSQGMDEQSTTSTDAQADTSVTVEAPVVEAQTTEAQTIPAEVASVPEEGIEPKVADAGVQAAPATAPEIEAPEVNG